MYKEALPTVIGLLIILGATGVIKFVITMSNANAYEQYQKTSLPAIWKKMDKIDFSVDLNKSFEYTLYEVINQGGFLEPGEFLEKIYNIFSEHMRNYPHKYNYEININPSPKNFASGQSSAMEVELEVRIKGANVDTTKIVKGNLSSDIRAEMLYEKAYMFYKYALKGESIHCFSWDGNNKITVTFYSFDNEQGKIRLSWNSTQAKFKVGSNGIPQIFDSYETFECSLSNKQTCTLELNLKGNKAIIYRTQLKQDENCNELICENSLPVLVEKGKSYSICINAVNYLSKPLPELINETVENECKGDCLPRSASGVFDSCDCDNTPDVKWVLAKAASCENVRSCPRTYPNSNLISCLKENLREFIEGYIDKNNDGLKISARETTEDVEWRIKVIMNELNYHYTEGENCPKDWTIKCGDWSCESCDTDETENSGSVSTSGAYRKYLFARYRSNDLYWNFTYKDKGAANKEPVRSCREHSNEHCPPPPTCECGFEKKCEEKKAYEYGYSFSYDYTYTLKISIKDLKRNIILAE